MLIGHWLLDHTVRTVYSPRFASWYEEMILFLGSQALQNTTQLNETLLST